MTITAAPETTILTAHEAMAARAALRQQFSTEDPAVQVDAVGAAHRQHPGEFAVLVVNCTAPATFAGVMEGITRPGFPYRLTRSTPSEFGWRLVLAPAA
jgi:hypothetical protein